MFQMICAFKRLRSVSRSKLRSKPLVLAAQHKSCPLGSHRFKCLVGTFVQVQVSIRRIQYEKAWSKVEEMQTEDVVFEGPIIAVNRGGAIVLVEVCG